MSYDVSFKVKVEGVDFYIDTGYGDANITWNLREMIVKSTGLEWKNCRNNGLCKDVIPCIERGLAELKKHPQEYKKYEAANGWGTLEEAIHFFETIIKDWEDFIRWNEELVPVATFWIE